MAIETARVLKEIEKHTERAKAADAAKLRESAAAIRALCDLLLDEEVQATVPPRAIPLAASEPAPVSSLNRLDEEDANKDSIFEF